MDKFPLAQRVRKYIERIPGVDCWLWVGSTGKTGYGNIIHNGKIIQATHASVKVFKNLDVPKGMVLMHTCDSRWCVNPDHLVVGTKKQNSEDMTRKRRQAFGEKHGQAKLNNSAVDEIRASSEPVKSIASKFGVSVSLIRSVRYGHHWNHMVPR